MSRISPEENARIGIFHLEEAILDILMEGMYENERVGPAEITRRTGIPGASGDHKYWPAWSFLQKLVAENRVNLPERGKYVLTDEEFARRRDRP